MTSEFVIGSVNTNPVVVRRILTMLSKGPLCPVGGTIQAALSPTLDAAEGAMLGSLAKTTVADLLSRGRP